MNKLFTPLLFALICISGCGILFRSREKGSQFPSAAHPEWNTANVTPELDLAKAWFASRNDQESQPSPLPLLLSHSTARHQQSEKESARKLDADSTLFLLFSDEAGLLLASVERQATCRLDKSANHPGINFGFIQPDVRNVWPASPSEMQLLLTSEPWHLQFPSNYRPLLDDGWIGEKRVTVGISETPTNSLNEMPTAANAFLTVRQGKYGDWGFGMSYSGTGRQPYPFPRVQYNWQPSGRIHVNTGFMFPKLNDFTFDFTLDVQH